VGHKKSGKTTLVEQLAAELTSCGLTIGTIKMTTHDLQFDSPGKDTHRHRIAGSKATLIKSKSQMALFTDQSYLDDELVRAIFNKCDFVFIEGDSSATYPKIYVADQRDIRSDIRGEVIAIWGEQKEMAKARQFENTEIDKLSDFLINKYKKAGN
jgi:molybdopterin-guanine dinucleotide biosynthesis protein MobB